MKHLPFSLSFAVALLCLSAQAQTLPAPPVSPAPITQYEYDAQGNPTKTVQAPGTLKLSTQATYDSLSRLKDSTDAKLGKTKFGYDGLDRTLQITDPRNLVTQTPRNGLGDTTQLVSPDTGTASHTYDAAGNLKTRTDSRGVKATHTYDALNRLTKTVYSQGATNQTFSWSYDQIGAGFTNGIGRLTSTAHPSGSTTTRYDPQGRVTADVQRIASAPGANAAQVSQTVTTTYNPSGQVTSIVYPSGRKLSITITAGQPSAMGLAPNAGSVASPLISAIQWEPFGPARSWQWQLASGAQTQARVFDSSGRLVRYRFGPNVRDLSYDAADRISAYTHYNANTGAAQPALNQSFNYDELGRLTQTTLASGAWSFSYDANGNRKAATVGGSTSNYTTAATNNRLTNISNPSRSFSYDNAGNTTNDGKFSATYDLAGRMATLTKAGITTTYSYDGFGRRVRKVSSSGAASTVIFVYGQAGELLGEYDSTGKAIREVVWLGATPIAVFTPDPVSATNPPLVYFIHTDHLDTPRVVVDKNNQIRWRWMSEPFGVNAPETNPSGLGVFTFNLRLPGQVFDQESGLHYNWFRSYDSGIGRYTTSDPIGLAGGSMSTYAYVNGNPLSAVDPNGLQRRTVTPAEIVEFITPGGYTQPITQSNVVSLTARIRMYDSNFQYSTIAPRGYRYNQQDVRYLSDLLRQYEESAVCTANGLPRPRINYGGTPNGLPFTRHYGTETGPVRQLPGSVLDEAIGRGSSSINPNGTTTHYDPVNNITVVVGQGGVVSAHRGPLD